MGEFQSWRVLINGVSTQGADYRQWLLAQAADLGVGGWVQSGSDGGFELLVTGNEAAVLPFLGQIRMAEIGGAHSIASVRASEKHSETFIDRDSGASTEVGDRRRESRSSETAEDEIERLVQTSAEISAELKKKLDRYTGSSRFKSRSQDQIRQFRKSMGMVLPYQVAYMTTRRLQKHGTSVGRGISFHAKMVEASESIETHRMQSLWKLDDKALAYNFTDRLGVARPAASADTVKFASIEPLYPCVVKNARGTGSRGCYLVHAKDHIAHLYDSVNLDSWEAMAEHAEHLMDPSGPGRTLRDRWLVEELILDPKDPSRGAADVKFYAFYGQIEFVLEMRRDRGREYSFASIENEPIESGLDVSIYQGEGVSAEDVAMIQKISLEIPYPFMRIDMLRGRDGLVFGEFTPRTGSFDEFSLEMDRKLGQAWVDAESRLWSDLLDGKKFVAFRDAVGATTRGLLHR